MPATGDAIREVVVKIHERCNLACDHCYMYEAADQSWRGRPVSMSDDTVRQVARRLAEHAREHALAEMRVVLHGGEPLLAGPAKLSRAIEAFTCAAPSSTRVSFAIQTNGVLLGDQFLDLFRRHRVQVGVSLDGGRDANDRHRNYVSGRSSYDQVARAVERLRKHPYREIYGGLLCTVDLNNDPVQTYTSLLAHEPPMVDFLLPHGNWAYPPPGLRPRAGTPYADWLIPIFDRWFGAARRETGIRLFESMISIILGGRSSTEAIGLDAPAAITIESDGSVEGSDGLKTTAPAGGAIGLNVFDHTFDEVAAHPAIAAARLGLAGLGAECRQCPVVAVCGGGLHAHRFSTDDGFNRPSVYSADLARVIRHVHDRLEVELTTRDRALAEAKA